MLGGDVEVPDEFPSGLRNKPCIDNRSFPVLSEVCEPAGIVMALSWHHFASVGCDRVDHVLCLVAGNP